MLTKFMGLITQFYLALTKNNSIVSERLTFTIKEHEQLLSVLTIPFLKFLLIAS